MKFDSPGLPRNRQQKQSSPLPITPQSLATYEAQAEAYRELFEMAEGYPANLTDETYLVCEVVPALIEEVRHLRGAANE
ncbi:hypothetical protein [Pseudoxanthomonas beigongshangi]